MAEVYVSVDIEADGPIPGDYSMLSLGSAAFDEGGELLETFQANLKPLEGATQHPKNMAWWKTQPEAWEYTQKCRMDPANVMRRYNHWLATLPGRPVFVGYPVTFDFAFVHWYMVHFVGHDPFGFQGVDIKTYAMARMGTEFKDTVKGNMPSDWFDGSDPHTHIAWEDAVAQGRLFFKIRESLHQKVGRRRDAG